MVCSMRGERTLLRVGAEEGRWTSGHPFTCTLNECSGTSSLQAAGPGFPVGLSQFGRRLFTQKGDVLYGWRGTYQNTTKAAVAGAGGMGAVVAPYRW